MENLNKFADHFLKFDADNDGFIEMDEFVAAYWDLYNQEEYARV